MENWKFIAPLPVCVIAHLFGYLVPTVTFIYNFCSVCVALLSYTIAALLATLFRLWVIQEPEPASPLFEQTTHENVIAKTKSKLSELKSTPVRVKNTPLVSRNVDDVIDELIGLLLRDYVSSWYSPLVPQQSVFCEQLKEHVRQMLLTLHSRCQKIPDVELFSSDFVAITTEHLKQVRCAIINPAENIQPYKLYKFLTKKTEELDHLRVLTEFLLGTLLPPEYARNKPLCCLLREVFAVSVFYPVIDKLCDPDFINTKLISYFEQQHVQAEKLRKKYEYAENYEDFIKLIQETVDLELLQRIRYHMATEIMQATTSRNVKLSMGMDADKEFIPQNTNKGDLLQARNLPRYLNQLQFARTQIERRLKSLGGAESCSPRSEGGSVGALPGQKVLSMSVLMQSPFCRRYFSKFLQKEAAHSLLGFWEGVEDMKHSDKEQWHKLGSQIVQIYVYSPSSCVKLNKSTLRGIEEFMLANKGPEAYFQAQEEVYRILESHHYASFIVSDVYHKMLTDIERKGFDFVEKSSGVAHVLEDPLEDDLEKKLCVASDISVFDHSSYARSQLKILMEKLGGKKLALDALKNNPKFEKTVTLKLELEVSELINEQNMLENHIEKTELWIEYLGKWQATIMDAMERKENDKEVPYFVIKVQLSSDVQSTPKQMAGWVVSRNLNAFRSLHQKLVPAANWLKKLELPNKPRFKTFDRNYLEKAKVSLQTFVSAVTKDDGLNKSEALYDFLSPSPEYMKHPPSPKKSNKSNFLQFLKGVQTTLSVFDDTVEEELLFLDDCDGREDKQDSIAEPMYLLIFEIFELEGVFSWLRKKLMVFVQITYGQTINRYIREMVSYVLSEPMLLFYLQLFRDTLWPPGQKTPDGHGRSDIQKKETKIKAKKIVLGNPSVLLNKLLGQENAKKGLSKVFDALQNKKLNKQLFYKLFEAFLFKYAPELMQASELSSIEEDPTSV